MTQLHVNLRRLRGLVLIGLLAFAAAWGFTWAMNPEPSTGFTVRTEEQTAEPVPVATTSAPGDAPGASPTPAATPTPTPTPTGPPPEELIAAAAEPSATSVQVLDAGGGPTLTDDAVSAIEELGYNVVAVSEARVTVTMTTAWFTDGNEAQAEALRARDPRIAEVEANLGLNEGVDVHVLVGADWQ